MQQENILGYPDNISIHNPNISWSFSETYGKACIVRVLVNFPVFWHKQPLEPSLVYPSSEFDH